jgi:hypothetical protein
LNEDVKKGCKGVLAELKSDLNELRNYRIPPLFFGPGAQ